MELKHLDTKIKDVDSDEIKHYGVLGMKWGIRKQPDGSKARTGSAQDNSTGYEPDNPGIGQGGKPAKLGSSRSPRKARAEARTMSDDELKTAVKRLNLEQDYVRLTSSSKNQSLMSKGADEVQKVLANSARNIATNQVTKGGNALVNRGLSELSKKAKKK